MKLSDGKTSETDDNNNENANNVGGSGNQENDDSGTNNDNGNCWKNDMMAVVKPIVTVAHWRL